MTRLFRPRCAAVLLALVAGGVAVTTPASAAPPDPAVTVRATATGPTSGAANDHRGSITVTIDVADAPAPAAVLRAPVPGDVAAAAVTVDGAPAPTGTVSAASQGAPARTDVTVRLGTGATVAAGGLLGIGRHAVTIPVDLTKRAGTEVAPVAVTFDFANASNRSVSARVAIPLADLVVTSPDGTGQDTVLPLGPGDTPSFFAEIAARNGPVSSALLVITIPRGLALDTTVGVVSGDPNNPDNKGGELACTQAADGTVGCPLGRVDQPRFVAIPLRRTSAARDGATATFTVGALAANGLEATPADNAVSGTVRFTPVARLRIDLSADRTRIEVGSKTRVTARVTNVGSYPAADVFALLAAGDKTSTTPRSHFRVTGFTGRASDLVPANRQPVIAGRVPRELRQVTTLLARRAAARQSAAKRDPGIQFVMWSVGTLAPRTSRTSVLTLQAVSPGPGTVVAFAGSPQSDNCAAAGSPAACPQFDQLELRAVAAAGTNGAGADPIAATGVPTGRWAGLALLLLVLGAAAQFAGVRRQGILGRHRS